ncbi:MAG: SMP-30/gluconolactonase/LRE family protein [Burkholderiaceae bacterium]
MHAFPILREVTGLRELETTLALDAGAKLGECLFWDTDVAQLWMVDIHGRRVLRRDLCEARAVEWRLPLRVGWVLPDQSGRFLVMGLQPGVACAPLNNPCANEGLARPFGDNLAHRPSDAKADRTGAIRAGGMNNDGEELSDDCLFRLDAEGRLTVVDAGYYVANGPAISTDGRLILHTDSGRRTIYAFDLDMDPGELNGKRVWETFAEGEACPDGRCFDVEGALWMELWGASCLRRSDVPVRLLRCSYPRPAGLQRLFHRPALQSPVREHRARRPVGRGAGIRSLGRCAVRSHVTGHAGIRCASTMKPRDQD